MCWWCLGRGGMSATKGGWVEERNSRAAGIMSVDWLLWNTMVRFCLCLRLCDMRRCICLCSARCDCVNVLGDGFFGSLLAGCVLRQRGCTIWRCRLDFSRFMGYDRCYQSSLLGNVLLRTMSMCVHLCCGWLWQTYRRRLSLGRDSRLDCKRRRGGISHRLNR